MHINAQQVILNAYMSDQLFLTPIDVNKVGTVTCDCHYIYF